MPSSSADIARYFALEQPKLRAFIRSLVFNPADVDDILQDVAVVAIENAHRYDSSRSLEAWIIGIAKKRILKLFEKRERQKLCFSTEVVDALAAVAISAESDASASLDSLQVCLQKLDDDKRSLLIRRHSPGATARELAREIGYTDTRMSRLLNGLYATLMKCVQRRQADGSVAT